MRLIDGKIQANEQCPYYKDCKLKCPLSDGGTIDKKYSCGLARYFDIFCVARTTNDRPRRMQ